MGVGNTPQDGGYQGVKKRPRACRIEGRGRDGKRKCGLPGESDSEGSEAEEGRQPPVTVHITPAQKIMELLSMAGAARSEALLEGKGGVGGDQVDILDGYLDTLTDPTYHTTNAPQHLHMVVGKDNILRLDKAREDDWRPMPYLWPEDVWTATAEMMEMGNKLAVQKERQMLAHLCKQNPSLPDQLLDKTVWTCGSWSRKA